MRSKSHTIPCLPIQSVSSIAFHFSDSNGKSYIAAGGISPTNRIHVYVYQHDEHEGTSTWQKVDVDHNGKEHLETVSAVAFSKCGGRLASGCLASGRPVTTHAGLSKNRNVRLSSCIVYYKRQIGNQIQYDFITKVELQGHIMSMVFFPEVFCSAIAIGTSDTVKVYKEFNSGNHQDYELVKTPFEDDATMKKKGQVNALSCCPQSTLLSIGFAKMLQIFSYSEDDTHSVPTVSFTQIIEIYVGSSIVTSVFLPNFDTPMIAIGGDDCNLKVYCVATGQQHMSIPHNHTIRTVDFKSCGNYIATGSKDGVKIIDIWRKKVIQSFKTTTLCTTAFCTHNQCSNTGNTGVPSISQIAKNGPHANSIRFGKTKITDISENLFIGSSMNKIIGLNMDILLRDTIHYFEDVKKSLTYFSPDGKWIVVGAHRCAQSSPSSMNVYKMSDLLSESNKLSDDVKIALEIKKAHHVHFSSDSTQILTATGQGGITIYEMSDNGTDWEVNPIISIDLTTKTNFITGALFSSIANDTILITDAKEVKLYHLHDRKVMGSRSFEQFNKLHAIVTPDMSKFVVIEPKQRFFPICDTTSLKEMCNDICEIKNLNTVALTDSTIAVADSNEVKIYNIFDDIDDALNSDIECPFNTPKHVDTFEVHAPVTVLSFNQDKTKLGVGCEDGRVLVYAMRSKSEEPSLFSFCHFPEKVTSLSFWNNSSQEFGNETIVLAITCGKHAIVQQFHKLNYSLCNPRDLNEDNYGCTIAAEFLMLFKDEDIIKAAKRNRSSGIQRGSLASGTLLTYALKEDRRDLINNLVEESPDHLMVPVDSEKHNEVVRHLEERLNIRCLNRLFSNNQNFVGLKSTVQLEEIQRIVLRLALSDNKISLLQALKAGDNDRYPGFVSMNDCFLLSHNRRRKRMSFMLFMVWLCKKCKKVEEAPTETLSSELLPKSSDSPHDLNLWNSNKTVPDKDKRVRMRSLRVLLPDLGSFKSLRELTEMQSRDAFDTLALDAVIHAHWRGWARKKFISQGFAYGSYVLAFTVFCELSSLRREEEEILNSWFDYLMLCLIVAFIFIAIGTEMSFWLTSGHTKCASTTCTSKRLYWSESLCFGVLFLSFLAVILFVEGMKGREGDLFHYLLISLILLESTYFSWIELRQLNLLGWQDYLFSDSWNIRQLATIILTTASTIFEIIDHGEVGKSAILKAFALLFIWSGLLFYGRSHEKSAWIITAIFSIIAEIFPFLIILVVILLMFSSIFRTLYLKQSMPNQRLLGDDLCSTDPQRFTTLAKSFVSVFYAGILNSAEPEDSNDSFNYFVTTIFSLMMHGVITVIALNALIAFISDAFETVRDQRRAVLNRSKARFILDMYCMMNEKQRNELEEKNRWTYILVPYATFEHDESSVNHGKSTKDDIVQLREDLKNYVVEKTDEMKQSLEKKLDEKFDTMKTQICEELRNLLQDKGEGQEDKGQSDPSLMYFSASSLRV